LVSRADKSVLDRIVKFYKLPIVERTLPTEEEVEAVVAERLDRTAGSALARP
jgi:hypothetical protein